MVKMRKGTLLLILLPFVVASCASSRKIVYFQGVDEETFEQAAAAQEMRITPGDNLSITVSSRNPEAVEMFNSINPDISLGSEMLNIMGYIVDTQGDINFPLVGKVHVGGLTKSEATEVLSTAISKYATGATVNIRFLNFKITVLGEVVRPGTFTIRDERINIPEALGLAGDMTIYGKRDNVLVMRNVDGLQSTARLDMTSSETINSEYFYLRQNDVVYVQPNRTRTSSSSLNPYLGVGLSAVSVMLSIISIITR